MFLVVPGSHGSHKGAYENHFDVPEFYSFDFHKKGFEVLIPD